MVIGPGFIVLAADNDVGGITKYAADAKFHHSFVWIMIISALAAAHDDIAQIVR